MSRKIVFITGGVRSGKSRFALASASAFPGKKGFIATAGALIANSLEPATKDYMIAAHTSAEIGHRAMIEEIGLVAIFDLGMRLDEGTGAALAMQVIEAGLKIYREMATFGEAGVSAGGGQG